MQNIISMAVGLGGIISLAGLLEKIYTEWRIWHILIPIWGEWLLYRAVFGSGLFLLLAVAISFALAALAHMVNPLFIFLLLIYYLLWHIVFSISLAKAFDETKVFALFLIFLPGIGRLILAYNGSKYQGPVI